MHRRRSENHTGRGWGIAALVVGMALLINACVAYLHYSTSSRKPTDPMYRAVGGAAEHRAAE
jgi:hypothetical protein